MRRKQMDEAAVEFWLCKSTALSTHILRIQVQPLSLARHILASVA